MIQGKDRGKKGKILRVLSLKDSSGISSRVVVEGLNTIKKHQKARKQGQKGQIIVKERAVSISNVQLICPKCDRPTRLGSVKEGKEKKRICKKCKATIWHD